MIGFFKKTCKKRNFLFFSLFKNMNSKIEIAKKYFDLSNDHKLNDIYQMFEEKDCGYETTILKVKHDNLDDIKKMMDNFFNNLIPDVHWDVLSLELDDSFHDEDIKNYKKGDAVLVKFNRKSFIHEEFNNKLGQEWILINDNLKIYFIKVVPLQN
jgi:hypothetical protein